MGLLLDAGAFVDPVSEEGTTPIMLAAMRGEGAAVLLLANSGADLKRVDMHGYGLKDYAEMDRKNETLTIVTSLMDPSAKQGMGRVPVVLDGNLLALGAMSLKEVRFDYDCSPLWMHYVPRLTRSTPDSTFSRPSRMRCWGTEAKCTR
jgi:ankyrin repeat protein